MFVYTFEPHPQEYEFVGAIVIIARSFLQAEELYHLEYPDKVNLVEKLLPLTRYGRTTFILISVVPTRVDENIRVVCSNWGYIE